MNLNNLIRFKNFILSYSAKYQQIILFAYSEKFLLNFLPGK